MAGKAGQIMSEIPVDWEELSSEANPSETMTAEVDPSMALGNGGAAELPYDMSEWSSEDIAAYNALRSKRKKCCIGCCTPRSLPIARSYHQLPLRNQEVWAKWVEVIRWSRNDPAWTPNGDAAPLVCSRHFPDTDFISYEASSRVRLSHTAIPVYYVDPPEGTEMDARFSSPLPIPPMIAAGKIKAVVSKTKQKMEEQHVTTYYNQKGRLVYEMGQRAANHDHSGDNQDNYMYDIEEVNSGGYGDNEMQDDEDEGEESLEENYYGAAQFICKPEIGSPSEASDSGPSRSSRLPSLIKYRNNQMIKSSSSSKPPGLIRANFSDINKIGQRSSLTNLHLGTGNMKSILKKDLQPTGSRSNAPTKHKIGLAKCRLIVQTLDNQLKIAKMRLAEQLDIPYQVVHGVWNMRDNLKDKL